MGTFRDLALQGIDVLMVDRGDFCSGASAASSRMAHGGLKYLENGEFRLVKEALAERNRLLQNAPHYVRPLPTLIPIFHLWSGLLNAPLKFLNLLDKPGERGAIVIKAGLTMYDLFTRGQQTLPSHKFFLRGKSFELFPDLNPEIMCTAAYYDGQMPYAERMCMEMILDTEVACPEARALNYVSVRDVSGDEVVLEDAIGGQTFSVRPQVVVNAAGPWIDLVNQSMNRATRFIGGTKGSHLVLDCPALHAALHDHELYYENEDGRICLMLPFFGKVIIGSTDIPVDDPDQVRCTDEEVDYLLAASRKVFPKIAFSRDDIVFRFAGVRPLPVSDAKVVGQITRDHSIEITEATPDVRFPILSLVGGKWTTFRAFGEQTADAVLQRLGKARQTSTRELAIGGGKDYPRTQTAQDAWLADLQRQNGLDADRARLLFERYGTRAAEVGAFLAAGPDAPLGANPGYTQREIMFLAQQEKVLHLDDLILRRTVLGMAGEVNAALLAELGSIVGGVLAWSAEQITVEIEFAATLLHNRHGVSAEALGLADPSPSVIA